MDTNSQGITILSENVENDAGSQAIIMEGQCIIPSNSQSILVSNNDTQYFIQNAGDLFNYISEPLSINQNEVFDLNNTESQETLCGNQIVYYTGDADILPKSDLTFMDVIDSSEKKEEPEFIDLESLLNIRAGNEWTEDNETNGCQYLVQLQNFNSIDTLPDDKLGSVLDHSYNSREFDVEPQITVDISKITGKNLLTGQKVTLESYLEKVKNSSKELTLNSSKDNTKKKNEHTGLSNLLNKKLTIGKTLSGQRLVGKVIHVGKKDEEKTVVEDQLGYYANEINVLDLSASYYESVENHVPSSVIIDDNNEVENILMNNINEMLVLDKTENVLETIEIDNNQPEPENSEDNINQTMLEYVTKIMTNMMNMESVLKKLKRKNLLIKVVEKVVEGDVVKVNTHQVGGHLEMLGGWRKREYEEKWVFKLDFEKTGNENGDWVELWPRKFPETIRLTINIVKTDGLIHSTKVNLNYSLEKCSMCSKSFRSIYKLKTHMKLSHDTDYQHRCKICDELVDSKDIYNHHKLHYVESNIEDNNEQKLSKTNRNSSSGGLKLHCTVCGETFDQTSTLKEHLLWHDSGYKSSKVGRNRSNDLDCFGQSREVKNCYVCKVCNRTFSRYSNLQRHSEIHGTKNSMALYSCSMCGCTYNYISSLTRHIVQNHVSAS